MDQDLRDKLASGEYSISPRSGRLRKRIRVKEKKSFFKRSKVKRFISVLMWALLIGSFLVSLILVFPELNIVSDKNKRDSERSK